VAAAKQLGPQLLGQLDIADGELLHVRDTLERRLITDQQRRKKHGPESVLNPVQIDDLESGLGTVYSKLGYTALIGMAVAQLAQPRLATVEQRDLYMRMSSEYFEVAYLHLREGNDGRTLVDTALARARLASLLGQEKDRITWMWNAILGAAWAARHDPDGYSEAFKAATSESPESWRLLLGKRAAELVMPALPYTRMRIQSKHPKLL